MNEGSDVREEAVKRLLARPHTKLMIDELVRQIKADVEPAIFACIWLEFMRVDEDSLRKDAVETIFYIASRSWNEVRDLIFEKADEDGKDTLMSPKAEQFYNKWLRMVTKQVAQYYDEMSK